MSCNSMYYNTYNLNIYIYIYIYICIYIYIYVCIYGGLSTLCHSWEFACQQRVLKTFPGPGYLHSEDGKSDYVAYKAPLGLNVEDGL